MVWQEDVNQIIMLTNLKEGRKLKISKTITQYQYTAWPDHGTPYPLSLLLFLCHVTRVKSEEQNSPTLVHYSAGIGRTGT